ncbi:MFS transporter [Lutispora sp.]|uniref:MFS transporter n=1 Tax=Lutispora sp. TaxID=2828727 RepID=UPI002B219C10|nr:MFS transporter [Lutispora sp.]MEA4960789.1 MFS transporter [Lutispora sp.]
MSSILYKFKHNGNFSKQVKLYMLNTFISYLVMSAFANVLQGIYFKRLGFEEGFIGNVIALKTVLIGLSAVPVGMLSDIIGRKRAVMLGVIISSLGYLGQCIFTSQLLIYFFACLNGIGSAVMYVNDAPFLAENCEEEKRINLFSINFIINQLASIFGSYSGGRIPELFGGESISILRGTQVFFSLMVLLALVPLYKIKNEKTSESIRREGSFFSLLKRKNVVLIITYNMLIGFGAGLVIPFFNLFLHYKLNVGTRVVGTIMAYSQVATIIGAFLVPYVSKKLGRVFTVQLCQILSIPFLLIISIAGNVWLTTFVFFMRSALMNMAQPALQSLTMEIVGDEERSALSSLMNLSNHITRGISASVAGFLMANVSYELPYYITAVLYITAILLFARIFDSGKRKIGSPMIK